MDYQTAIELREIVSRFSNAIAAFAEISGMVAENKQCEIRGESMAYVKDNFDSIIRQYGL